MAGNDDSAAARASSVVHTSHAASSLFNSISPDYLNGQEAATPEAAEATTTKPQREKKKSILMSRTLQLSVRVKHNSRTDV